MPNQILPKDAYTSPDWFEREKKQLFAKTWHLAGYRSDLKEPGDYLTFTIAGHPLVALLNSQGELQAFHNLCRHRGTELLEGKGNTGKTIVCPYHRWTYMLDGRLRGLPNRECFPDFDRNNLGLHPAAVGSWMGLIFVNPDPEAKFEEWSIPLNDAPFPHDITDKNLVKGDEFVYKINCNWKVFYENAIDGYHLAYLHENTLGGPLPALNKWVQHGNHMVWYSTERDGLRNRIPKFVEDQAAKHSLTTIKGADQPGYGGVYMLFPTTLITPSPWSLTVSRIEPLDADTTVLRAQTWVANSWFRYSESAKDAEGFNPETGMIESKNWKKHPLQTGDFQTEDIWVCEKMQRSLRSPKFSVGPMARGRGGEDMLPLFQKQVLSGLEPQE